MRKELSGRQRRAQFSRPSYSFDGYHLGGSQYRFQAGDGFALFRLRRCIAAASFSRSYTASGMFFSVSVVGMLGSVQNRTTVVPFCGCGQAPVGLPVAPPDVTWQASVRR